MAKLHVVTGGSGYFGNLLVAKLLERGDQVRIFDILDADDRPAEVRFVQPPQAPTDNNPGSDGDPGPLPSADDAFETQP